jgi:hypothetical protein
VAARSKKPLHRPSITIEGLHSTVPGHFADLDWSDLRKR